MTTRNAHRTTFHIDGTVTVWDVYRQTWMERVDPGAIRDEVLASLPEQTSELILKLRAYSDIDRLMKRSKLMSERDQDDAHTHGN